MRASVKTMASRSGNRPAALAIRSPTVESRKGLSLIAPCYHPSPNAPGREDHVSAKPFVPEVGMGVDVHGGDCTTAAWRAVSDAIRHSSLPFFTDVRKRGGRMLVDVTVGAPDPASVDVERVRRELPHGEVTVRAQSGG